MKGDSVRVLIDVGAGASREFIFEARLNGRRFEVTTAKGQVTVEEQVPSGRVIKTATFQQARCLAVIEEPIEVEQDVSQAIFDP